MRISQTVAASLAAFSVTLPTLAQDSSSVLDQKTMYGVSRSSAELHRYDFDAQTLTSVGLVQNNSRTLFGIDAITYVPGFQNLFGFWYDSTTQESQLLYINVENAEAAIVAEDMEGGKITGAATVPSAQGGWSVYGIQLAESMPPFRVSGLTNLNPNNNSNMEFRLVMPNGSTVTRDDLHQQASIASDGTLYQGQATHIRFRPKGNGNQNGLIINGEAFPLKNSNTYILEGELTVRVYNDKPQNGKAMGHWWMQIIDGTAVFGGDLAVQTPDRLVHIDHQTGTITELMPLTRGYDSLASADGVTFYATTEDKIYRLDPAAETETLVAAMSIRDVFGLDFADDQLMGFEVLNDRLVPVNLSTGESLNAGYALGARELGSIIFVDKPSDAGLQPKSFD